MLYGVRRALLGGPEEVWEPGDVPRGVDEFEVWSGDEYPMIFAITNNGDGFEWWQDEEQPSQGIDFMVFE